MTEHIKSMEQRVFDLRTQTPSPAGADL
jgi:hypothetical protein